MSQPKEQQSVPSLLWWVQLNSWLLRGLLFLWSSVGLGLALNVGATFLTSKGFDLRGTPLEWPAQHPLIVLSCCGGLLLLTVASYVVNRRTNMTLPTTRQVLPSSQNRMALLHLLRQEYNRQLVQSLQGAAILQLRLQERTDVVFSPAQLVSWHLDNSERQVLPPSTSIIEVYDHASTGFLLLGVPGAGKSTFLRELAAELLTRAEHDLTHPVPVILNLSSWSYQKLPLTTWLVEQLHLVYAIPRILSRSWIEQGQLLFLLDGLDEVAASARTDCIEEINRYRGEYFTPLVVCSRSDEYLSQPQQLRVPLAAEIQTLTVEQVNVYLKHAGTSMTAVRAVLRSNLILRDLVITPLMLRVVMLTYQGKRVKDLPQLGTVEEQQHQIFEHYVRLMLGHSTGRWHYTAYQTRKWLIWLAKQMNRHQLSEFYLELLQPDWLPIRWVYKLFPWIVGLIVGSVVALVTMLIGVQIGARLSGMVDGLIDGLIVGLLSVKCSFKIEPVEEVNWSWKKIPQAIRSTNRLIIVLIALLFLSTIIFVPLIGLLLVPFIGFIGLLFLGITKAQIDERRRFEPNQGILTSLRRAFRISIVTALLTLLFGGLFGSLLGGLVEVVMAGPFINGLVIGTALSQFFTPIVLLIGTSVGGGAVYLSHYILRFFLWRSKVMPWYYVRFLNEATDRILLQRVGGGYRFIHPLFQEYFASLDTSGHPSDTHP